jgi:hypothetical protein
VKAGKGVHSDSAVKGVLTRALNKDGLPIQWFAKKDLVGSDIPDRLWIANTGTFKRSSYATKSKPNVFVMRSSNSQVNAVYVNGKVFVCHNGEERDRANSAVQEYVRSK